MEFDIVNGKVRERTFRPFVEFYTHPMLDRAESDKQGRRVHVDTTYIKIRSQGAKDFVSRKATDEDTRNFQTEYNLFNTNVEHSGTDVALIVTTPSDLADILALGVNSVEKLAEIEVLPENLIKYRNNAKAYMKLSEFTDGNQIDGQGQEPAISNNC